MTDEHSEGTAPGADDTPSADRPEWDDTPAYDDDADTSAAVDDDSADKPAAASGGRQGPRIAVVASSVLLLIAIGAGLAFTLPGPTPQASRLAPSPGPVTGVPVAPTALPLLEATGEYSSTEVIAQVGEGTVIRGDFVRSYQAGADPAQVLDQLIQYELVVQQAASEGVTAAEADVTTQIDQIKQSEASGDDVQFATFLDHAQIGSEENLRRLVERDLIVRQMIMRHTSAEQAHARHILLATDATTDTAKLAEVKSAAEALMKELEGGADFAALAAERSDDPGSQANGGDLGWAMRGLFVGPFDEAVFSMKAGERRLVQTDFGWHIIELIAEPEVRPLESPDMLQTQPGQQAFADTFLPWIESLKQQAEADQTIKIVIPAEDLVAQPTGS